MTKQNQRAIGVLQDYAGLERPGYAVLIEAPWGAGKTHLVRQLFTERLDQGTARYVTLNGVADEAGFRRALIRDTPADALTKAGKAVGNALGNLAKVGNVGTLVADAVETRLINDLPDLLIFDDVERCQLDPVTLLGLLNGFVEHQGKAVVLCAFSDRDPADAETARWAQFHARKEKVVGRTVRIQADVTSALGRFVDAMPEGTGRDWLSAEQDLVADIFRACGYNNLRVLRQSLHECGRVIDRLDQDLRDSTDAMQRFVGTFLTLSMALATGELRAEHLAEQDFTWLHPEKPEKEMQPLRRWRDRVNANLARSGSLQIVFGYPGSVFPQSLGVSLIGEGYVDPEELNSTLRQTGHFGSKVEGPTSRALVDWRRLSSADLLVWHNQMRVELFEVDDIEPPLFLHIVNVYLDALGLSNAGANTPLVEDLVARIAELSEKHQVPPARFGWDYGLGHLGPDYQQPEGRQRIMDAMMAAQFEAFERSKPQEAARLLRLFQSDPEAFTDELCGGDGPIRYARTPILAEICANSFAAAVFDAITSGEAGTVGPCLEEVGRRIDRLKDKAEQEWAKSVRSILVETAAAAGPLEAARMDWLLGLGWPVQPDSDGQV